MKKNMAYVLGLILMFSTAGVYLNAQGMGGGYGPDGDHDMRMQQKEGMREGMKGQDDYQDKRSKAKYMKRMKSSKNMKNKKMGYDRQDIEKDVIATIKKHDSSFAKKLEKLKESNRRKYKLILQKAAKPLMMCKNHGGDATTMEKDMVEGIKLEYETRELSFKYKKASSSEKKAIEKKLKTKVARLFDLRAKGQELRIKKMTKEIGELQSKMKERKAHKSEIVKSRVDRLTGQGYTW
jgi:putative lipoic acid-binding regulatory protein